MSDVYEYPYGTIACFKITGNFVYPTTGLGTGQPSFEIKGPFWYELPSELAAQPAFQVRNNLVYAYPLGSTATYMIK